jgi:myo-inositol-1(or 4)-monophosphatase
MNHTELKDLLDKVEDVALKARQLVLREREKLDALQIDEKGNQNLVTKVDKMSEELLVSELSKLLPNSDFIAEEGTADQSDGSDYLWIIDPIDGTTNFVHGLPVYSISIALQEKGETVIALVYHISNDELFTAYKGGGTCRNHRKVSVSSAQMLKNSLVATGFPYDPEQHLPKFMELYSELLYSTRGLRRLGSAAIDMAYVACGYFDAFYEMGLKPWDIAAGALLIQEAGGKVSTFTGDDDFLHAGRLACSNGSVHDELITRIKPYIGSV